MLRLIKGFPIVAKAVRIKRIRDFVQSPTNIQDPTVFIELITDYDLVLGLDRLTLDDVNLNLVHDHVSKLLEHIHEGTENASRGTSPFSSRWRNNFDGDLQTWLRSEKGHYDPVESMGRVILALRDYQEAIIHYYDDYPETAIQRGIGTLSVTLKGLVSGLATHRYGMNFLGVSDERQ